MVGRMKTTIDLPDELATEAKRLATEYQVSLRELVVSGLRAELARRRTAPAVDFHFPTFAGDGLLPEVEASETVARSYDLLP